MQVFPAVEKCVLLSANDNVSGNGEYGTLAKEGGKKRNNEEKKSECGRDPGVVELPRNEPKYHLRLCGCTELAREIRSRNDMHEEIGGKSGRKR